MAVDSTSTIECFLSFNVIRCIYFNQTFIFYLTQPVILSSESGHTVLLIFHGLIIPGTSLVAIAGNATSIVILIRQGFRRCSNILLLSLAMSNILFLIGANNIPYYIYVYSEPAGFRFSEAGNYFLYILVVIFSCSYTVGSSMASYVPVIITVERLLAIFCPFKAHTILSPKRTIIVISFLCQITIVRCLYEQILSNELVIYVDDGVNTGFIEDSSIKNNQMKSGVYQLLTHLYNYTVGIIPISLITAGCIVIGFKIIQTSNRRRKLISAQVTKHSTTKTTKTLMMISLLYVLCNGFVFAVMCLNESKPLENEAPLRTVIYGIQNMVLCFNCLGDCLIYFGVNKGYWKRHIMGRGIAGSARK